MHCSRMLRLCAIPTALLLLTGVARGQVPATPDTTFGLPGNEGVTSTIAVRLFVVAAMENLGQEFRYFVPPVPAAGFAVANKYMAQSPEIVTKALQGMILNQIAMEKYPELVVRAFWKMNGPPPGDQQAALKGGVHYVEQPARTFKPMSDPASSAQVNATLLQLPLIKRI